MKTRTALTALIALATASFSSFAHASAGKPGPTQQPPPPKYADLVPIADPSTHMWTYINHPANNPNQYYVTIAVQNIGQADAGAFKVSCTFYNSQNNSDPVTVTVPFGPLAHGFWAVQFVPLPYGWGAGPSKNMLKFMEAVDSGDAVVESNEVNNFQLVYNLPYSTTPQ